MQPTILIFLALTIAVNLTVFIFAYLRYKQAQKKARQARFNSILPTSQTLSAKEQKAVFAKYNRLIFGALGLAYNEASAKGFKGKEEADAEQIFDLFCDSVVNYFAAKDGQTLRQYVAHIVDYCLPSWAFDQKQIEQTTSLICQQLDFILSFD